jgi:hypothetical protein
MGRFWIGLLVAIVVVLVIAAGSMMWLVNTISQERVTPLTTLNPDGVAGTALLVYHPGLSDFPDRIVTAFADGLVQSGWTVDRTTASGKAPAEFAAYDLVVLGSPIYGGPAKPLSDYIARADFGGKPVVLLLTGAGDPDVTLLTTVEMVEAHNGVVIAPLAYTSMRPNESAKAYSGSNVDQAVEMARDAGKALALPPAQ